MEMTIFLKMYGFHNVGDKDKVSVNYRCNLLEITVTKVNGLVSRNVFYSPNSFPNIEDNLEFYKLTKSEKEHLVKSLLAKGESIHSVSETLGVSKFNINKIIA